MNLSVNVNIKMLYICSVQASSGVLKTILKIIFRNILLISFWDLGDKDLFIQLYSYTPLIGPVVCVVDIWYMIYLYFCVDIYSLYVSQYYTESVELQGTGQQGDMIKFPSDIR